VEILTDCDIAFPILHGVNGEDGAAAGFLALSGVPYVGSPVGAGAFGMDKHVTKLIAASLGIRTANALRVSADLDAEPLPQLTGLTPPFVVKPTNGGSSNGVTVVDDAAGLAAAVRTALSCGPSALIEEYVRGREVDVAVFRDREGALRLGATLEIGVAPGGVFDRAEKYDGGASFTVPAPLSPAEAAEIQRTAALLYATLGCAGVARFDFFVTPDGVVLNEVNTAPGMTEQSQVPRMYAALGLEYPALIAALLEAAEGGRDVARVAAVRATPPASRATPPRRLPA
ncbi:D-alanine--D-alanine ligase family protein, partial [Leucobacter sp. M11]|uniref:D-alanine--D-alanine ligase family protein n=1 Tax=Leucobacter sp. M11 TaxID=2993565 RepID=UPI002D7F26E6